MKRLIPFIFLVCIADACLNRPHTVPIALKATNTPVSGDTLSFIMSGDTFTISGTGKMDDYSVERNTAYHSPSFYNRDTIRTVVIQQGVTYIGVYAFTYCSRLASITIPNSVTHIGSLAFAECGSLASVTIPISVTRIEPCAFRHCGLTSITLPDSITRIERRTFEYCENLTSVTIPGSVKAIEKGAFSHCSRLESITIPDNVVRIGAYVFDNCSSLTDINVDTTHSQYSSVNGVLYNKAGTAVIKYPEGRKGAYTIPDSVLIGAWSFAHCSGLTNINVAATHLRYSSVNGVLYNKARTNLLKYPGGKKGGFIIPNSVTSISYYAFYASSGLTSVTIPKSVTTIGSNTFRECSRLTSVINLNPAPQYIESSVFDDVPLDKAKLYVPASSVDAYKSAEGWRDFGSIRGI
jgi:hypothetical protein